MNFYVQFSPFSAWSLFLFFLDTDFSDETFIKLASENKTEPSFCVSYCLVLFFL